jgi:2-oxoglutarate dehydrogenase E2 component (dihydrolipoamide succinyltransferase)
LLRLTLIATLELPAEASGIITLKAEEGDAVAVGAVVCLMTQKELNQKVLISQKVLLQKRFSSVAEAKTAAVRLNSSFSGCTCFRDTLSAARKNFR